MVDWRSERQRTIGCHSLCHGALRCAIQPLARSSLQLRFLGAELPANSHTEVSVQHRWTLSLRTSIALATLAQALAPLAICAQRLRDSVQSPTVAEALALRSVRAVRIAGAAPVIDGRLDEAIWSSAPVATDFVRSLPHPGTIATLRTVARIAYDDEALYVGVRMFDPKPDGILAPFPRRDDETTSDWIFVEIDSRHDHRSGFSFGVNPRGVQVDGTWANDIVYDPAWNGVWESAAHMDSLGWTAEYRIPFSQLALSHDRSDGEMVLGLNIYRYSPHAGEVSNWSPRLPTLTGVVSHFNELRGIDLRAPPSQLEITPYIGARTAHAPALTGDASSASLPRGSNAVAGADARLALAHGSRARRDDSSGLRTGGGGSVAGEPHVLRDVLSRAAAVLHRERGSLHVQRGSGIGTPLCRRGRMRFRARARSTAAASDARRTWTRCRAARVCWSSGRDDHPRCREIGRASRRMDGAPDVLDAQTAAERATITDGEHGDRTAVVEPAAQFAAARATRDFRRRRERAGRHAHDRASLSVGARFDRIACDGDLRGTSMAAIGSTAMTTRPPASRARAA